VAAPRLILVPPAGVASEKDLHGGRERLAGAPDDDEEMHVVAHEAVAEHVDLVARHDGGNAAEEVRAIGVVGENVALVVPGRRQVVDVPGFEDPAIARHGPIVVSFDNSRFPGGRHSTQRATFRFCRRRRCQTTTRRQATAPRIPASIRVRALESGVRHRILDPRARSGMARNARCGNSARRLPSRCTGRPATPALVGIPSVSTRCQTPVFRPLGAARASGVPAVGEDGFGLRRRCRARQARRAARPRRCTRGMLRP
jgi:hypothetical protein